MSINISYNCLILLVFVTRICVRLCLVSQGFFDEVPNMLGMNQKGDCNLHILYLGLFGKVLRWVSTKPVPSLD